MGGILFPQFNHSFLVTDIYSTIYIYRIFHLIDRIIWQQTKASVQHKFEDVHTRLMKKNYDSVPQWWFYSLLIFVIGLAMLACEGFGKQLQLPYWGVLLAIFLALVFTLPIGVITATTNQVDTFLITLSTGFSFFLN